MGFLEKLKNTFFEEEYVEVEEKIRPKKEIVHEKKRTETNDIKPLLEEERKVRTIRKDEIVHEGLPKNKYQEVNNEKEKPKEKENKKNFDYFDDDFIDFYDENVDFVPTREEKETKKIEKDSSKIYNNPSYGSNGLKQSSIKVYSNKTESGFKPTPIISPIYGILDQNYSKEEIIEKKETRPSSYVSRKNVDLDSVREKAFGSLTGEFGLTGDALDKISDIENNETDDLDYDDNLLYDMTDVSTAPTVDKVTLQDAEEYFQDLGLEYNIDYKDAKLERATGRRVTKSPKIPEIEEDEIKENVSAKGNNDYQFSVEDNLFDLIDSMYEEKE